MVSSPQYRNYSVVGDANGSWSRLESLKVFTPASGAPTLDIVDVAITPLQRVQRRTFTNTTDLEDYIEQESVVGGIRYISICQKNSWASLEICQSMLRAIMRKHNIMPAFLETVRSFQDKTCNVEEAFGGTSWKSCSPRLKEMAFVLKYPENNGRSDGADPWSNRQTGVYQSFDSETKTSLWILLNPRPQSAADNRIQDLLSAGADSFLHLQEHRPLVGLIALSTYVLNWRTYMAFYEKEELRMSRIIISAVINEKLQFSHATLSELRRIEARLLLLPPIFHSLTQSIQLLAAYNNAVQDGSSNSDETCRSTLEILANYRSLVEAYSQNTTFLVEKIRKTAQLLSDTLNLKHQQIAQNTNENTLALTNAAVNDSATIRVITVVTLLYLPTTFVATLFGMQFFATDAVGQLTVSSSQLWIFFALAMPFTAATFAYWKWMDAKMRQKANINDSESN